MAGQEIHVIGNDDIVILLGLLGVNGTVVENESDFLTLFKELTNKASIGMIIIAFDLSPKLVDYIIEFKINYKKPFVYYLPDIFKSNIEINDTFWNHITNSLKKIIN